MNIRFTPFLFLLLLSSFTVFSQSFAPANKNATKETRALLSDLYSIRGKKILSGQHNYGHELNRSSDTIVAYTGNRPVIWGCDFAWIDRDNLVEEVKRQHSSGSIITLMFHMRRPFDADTVKRSAWKKMTDEQWNDLVTPGTEMHRLWQDQMDSVAVYLKKIQKAGIPVLWRPFHEMNGGWFWWGARPGPSGYQKMWKMLYDRYTNYHQLNNLIWVWNANGPIQGRKVPMDYELYYPGNEFVDVLAADIYRGDYKQSHHDQLLELGKGKLIAMGEIGEVPRPEILDQQPQWVWFMIWAGFPWSHNSPEEIKALYDHPKVLTKNEMDLKQKATGFKNAGWSW